MTYFAHIINPVKVPETSDLFFAQPITIETMRRARKLSAPHLKIKLFTSQFAEDMDMVPYNFTATPPLNRSILDMGPFNPQRKLPLLVDILDRLFESANDADYFIYSNVDIGVQPHFYLAIEEFVNSGLDAFVINRRTIPGHYKKIQEIPAMLAEKGRAHRGWDCFIFKKELYPKFKLGHVCVGANKVGLALLANMDAYSERFHEFQDEHLTFHIGDARSWLNPAFAVFDQHNETQVGKILEDIEADIGYFPPHSIAGRYLSRKKSFGPLYDFWSRHIYLPVGITRLIERISGRR